MIRYSITERELLERIRQSDSRWLAKAESRTQQYVDAGRYTGGTNFWSAVKQVYIDLQYEKCAYCETKLQGSILASKVHEIEHYRPKQSIKAWPNRNIDHWR